MLPSTSWVMSYHRRPQGVHDRVGGLPDHRPHVWPMCQLCQERMEFVGQLYACERLPLDGLLGLQFYGCDGCRDTGREANDRLPLHMELLPPDAPATARPEGVRCRKQPLRYIRYTAVEDPMDQWAFMRATDVEIPDDSYLFGDKVGGLFPYDGSDGPKITRGNRMLAQFTWAAVRGPIYLYHSTKSGLYWTSPRIVDSV
jgi:hypothetical protein